MEHNLLNNTVIEVLNPEHGQQVKKFWQNNGTHLCDLVFSCSKEQGHNCRYYGLINGKFSNYNLTQVKEGEAEIITLPPSKIQFQFQNGEGVLCTTYEEAEELLNLAKENGYQTVVSYNCLRSSMYFLHYIDGVFVIFENFGHTSTRQFSPSDFRALVTGRLPNHWCFNISEPNSREALNYLNETYCCKNYWQGTSMNHLYGFDGRESHYGTGFTNNIKYFKEDTIPLPVPYILEAIKHSPTLPKSWCVKWSADPDFKLVIDHMNENDGITAPMHWYGNQHNDYYGLDKIGRYLNSYHIKNFETLLTLEQFKQMTNKPMDNSHQPTPQSTIREIQTISRANAKILYDNVNCSEWKCRINEKMSRFIFDEFIPVTDEEIIEMFSAAGTNSTLISLLNKFFTLPKKEQLNLITHFPNGIENGIYINTKYVGNLFDEMRYFSSNANEGLTKSGHKSNLFLDTNFGTWYNEQGEPVKGYFYWKPKP